MTNITNDTMGIDWEFTLDTIREGKCILFLGPEVFTSSEGKKLDEAMLDFLQFPNNPDILNHYPEEDLFLFKNKGAQTKSYYKIKNFYQQSFPEAEKILEKIAQIPFQFIISMTPDNKLTKVYEKLNFKSKSDFYWRNHSSTTKAKLPSKDSPLVYNLFGTTELQESMVLSHDDLFDFFNSIFGARSIPKELKHVIQKAHNLVFLGIPFHKWYLQLLLRILSLHVDSDFMRYAANQSVDEKMAALVGEQFSIKFLPENVSGFIDELYKKCEEEGILKEASVGKKSIYDMVVELVTKDRIDEALVRVKDFLESIGDYGLDLLDDIILLTNRHKRLQKRMTQGILDFSDAEVETNKVRKSLLDLLNEVKTLE
ncbi:MAG: SIR2 family protein [Saprospiraceae bacterium]